MNDRNCKTCLHEEMCKSKSACDYYTPADDEMTDAEFDEYIESSRVEYRTAWWKYIDEDAE